MGCLKISTFLLLASAVGFGYFWHTLNRIPDIPELEDTYWGLGDPKPDDPAITAFQISVPERILEDLTKRLNNTQKLTPPLEGVNFQYGMNTNFLETIIEYWKQDYKWRARETFLNQLPQFRTQISGLQIHFLHVKPDKTKLKSGQEVVPLLLLHGWPSCVREFYDLIPMLVTPRPEEKFVFEVISPSLPGYGFSDGTSKPGLGYAQVGVIMRKLMQKLGFKKFFIQGGDWGSAIGTIMSILYPDSVLGFHSNMCLFRTKKAQLKMMIGFFFPSLIAERGYEEATSKIPFILLEEFGYLHLQATKPDTIGVAFTDSPAGLAAYILEKFSLWTNSCWRYRADGGLKNYKTDDLLDFIMIYWVTGSITTSMRIYSESFNSKHYKLGFDRIPINVPTACARFPSDIIHVPRNIIEESYAKVLKITDMPRGGHYPAFEVPDLLAEDIWQFIKIVRSSKPLEEDL